MKILLFLLLLLPAVATAQQQSNIYSQTFNTGGSIAVGGTAQAVKWNLTSPAIRCVTNDPYATETLWVSFNGGNWSQNAGVGVGYPLSPGAEICLRWTQGVTVYGATTGHVYGAFEAQ